jgi:adenylate cyclase
LIGRLLRGHRAEEGHVWFQEEARGERVANVLRILYMAIWLAAVVPAMPIHLPCFDLANVGGGLSWLGFGLVYHAYLMKHPYRPAMKYVSTTLDVVMTTAILFGYHACGGYSTTLKSPTFMNYLLVVPVTALRFDPRLALYAGALAVAAYAGLLGTMLAVEPVEIGSVTEVFTTPRINPVYELYKIAYLAALTLLTFVLVVSVRRLVALRTEEAELRLREEAGREAAQTLLRRYVSDQVAAAVLADPTQTALGGRSEEVTVLFADLDRFTTWSEVNDPEAIVGVLNEYFTAMEQIIFRHGGTLKQFVGDEIMVLFGAPFPQDDPEARAVRTAVEMKTRLAGLRREWNARGLRVDLDVKIGIHRGRVVVGNVGSPRRTEYAAVGDAVNVAARVMQLAPALGHPILITEDVYARANGGVMVSEFPAQHVKGRSAAVRVYGVDEVRGESGAWLAWKTADADATQTRGAREGRG